MSVLFKHMLLPFYDDHDFRFGVTARVHDRTHMIFASLGIVVSDETALKSTWEMKGASGTLICMACRNVVSVSSDLHNTDATGFFVPSSETDVSKFVLQTDDSVRRTLQLLKQQHPLVSASAFKKLEQSLGFNYRPNGLLHSEKIASVLQPVTMTMYDWMHCYAVSGVYNMEVGLLLGFLATIGIGYKDVHLFFQGFTWPLHLGSRGASGKTVFEKRSALSDVLKCSASEALSMYGVLRLFLMMHVVPLVDVGSNVWRACQSYFCVCAVLDLLLNVRTGSVTPVSLHHAVVRHLNAFKAIYGEERMTPKCHYTLHLSDMLRRHGVLVSCWVHERKHKELKRYANHLDNTSQSFETSVLESVLHVQLEALSEPNLLPSTSAHLVSPKLATAELSRTVQHHMANDADVFAAAVAMFRMQRCFRKDVAVVRMEDGTHVAEVWFHVSQNNVCVSCVSPWRGLGNNKFAVEDAPVLILTENIQNTCVYSITNSIATVAPCNFQ
ncbi:unnamed protein product, partial [Polarella glacialis]